MGSFLGKSTTTAARKRLRQKVLHEEVGGNGRFLLIALFLSFSFLAGIVAGPNLDRL
jgi:hypothetical protein